MSQAHIHIKSISQMHELGGFPPSKHPLISIIDVAKLGMAEEHVGTKVTNDLYVIGLKDKSCGVQYGRNNYDFDEGVLYFTAPNQVQTINQAQEIGSVNGWMISFHPDLIRKTSLGKTIDQYTFFGYDVFEALHLSTEEQETINGIVDMIGKEIEERIDNHSQEVLVSYIELILNISKRYYERQFNTRSANNSDVISEFEVLMKDYYESGKLREEGVPSIHYFSDKIALSPNYLSDLIKKETGQSAKDQINHFILKKAKNLLLSEEGPVSNIAYDLGFNYPHYFSRFFKSKTGMTPQEYRQIN